MRKNAVRLALVAFALLLSSTALAQPVSPSWRPPTGCTAGQTIVSNGAGQWSCGTTGITNSAGNNVVMKSNGTNAVASSITDDGTNVVTAENAFIGYTSGIGTSAVLNVGRDVGITSNGENGWRVNAFTDGNVYIDTKTITNGHTYFRLGSGAQSGANNTWLDVDHNGPLISFTGNTTVNGFETIYNTSQLTERLRLAGQEYLAPGNTDTDGPTLLLGQNRSGDRAIYIADSSALAQNNTNLVMRLQVGASVGVNIDAFSTDGGTPKTLVVQGTGGVTQFGAGGIFSGGTLSVFGGTAPPAGLGGVHTYFNTGTNTGTITSIQSGTANRPLNIQGNPIVLQANGGAEVTINSGSSVFEGSATVKGNTVAGDADTDTFIAQGTATIKRSTGTTAFSASNANLFLWDTQTAAQGVGGDLAFYGCYSGTGTCTTAGLAKAMKANGTTGDSDFNLSLGTHRNGAGDVTERLRIDATGATNALGQMVGVSGTYASYAAPDFSDVFYAGFFRKNLSLYSYPVGDDAATDGHWRHVNGSATLAYSTTAQDAPWGYNDTVGQITCTGGTCSSSGAAYDYIATSSTTFITDLRQKTVTLSVFIKTASGTNTVLQIGLARYNDNDVGFSTCTVNSSTWTRCTYTRTFNNTSYTDDSELRAYIYPQSTTAHYIAAAQIELGSDPTPVQYTASTLASHAGAYNVYPLSAYVMGVSGDSGNGIWAQSAGFGNYAGNPSVIIGPAGDIGARTFNQSMTGTPPGSGFTEWYGVTSYMDLDVNTTSGTRSTFGLAITNSSTRSSGGNDLIDYGLYVDVTDGQQQYAIFTQGGQVLLNNEPGSSTVVKGIAQFQNDFGIVNASTTVDINGSGIGIVTDAMDIIVPTVQIDTGLAIYTFDTDGFSTSQAKINGVTETRKSTDEDVTNSSTLVDDSDFVFNVSAGKIYEIDALIMAAGSDASGDYKAGWKVSGGTMDCSGTVVSLTTADAIQTSTVIATAAATTNSTSIGTRSDASIPIATRWTLGCKVSSNTNLVYQFAQAAAVSGKVARTQKGSVVRIRQLN